MSTSTIQSKIKIELFFAPPPATEQTKENHYGQMKRWSAPAVSQKVNKGIKIEVKVARGQVNDS